MKMKTKLTYLLLLLLLPLLGGCDEEDDVLEIFTEKTWTGKAWKIKTWKLTYIALEGQHQMFDFWNEDTNAAQRSLQLLEQGSTFIIEFNGGETADYVGGDFEARAVNRSVTGNWAANGASRELRLTDLHTSGNDTDPLARAFLTGLENTVRYSGDSQNLYIYYEDGQTTKCMAFHVQYIYEQEP